MLTTTHEDAEERSHHELQTGQVGGRTHAGGRCILWMGRDIFYGPRLTLTDSLNDVAEQNPPAAAAFRSREGEGGCKDKETRLSPVSVNTETTRSQLELKSS